jgi:phosphoserine phosphatase RsbU/P
MTVEIDTVPCGLLSFRDDGTIVAANDTLAAWFQKPAAEFRDDKFESLLTVAGRIFLQTHLFPLVALHGHANEIFLTFQCPSGPIPVVASLRRRATPEGGVTDCAFLPVPERRKYEDQILAAKRSAEEALRGNDQLETARRELEKHALELEQHLRATQRQNEELRRVVQILSHDLREPVRKIRLFSELAWLPQHETNAVAGNALQKIGALSALADSLTNAMRTYLSLDADEPVGNVPLTESIRQAAEQAAAVTQFTAWELTISPLPTLPARRTQIDQLFFHLFQNAIKFRDPARPLEVEVRGHVRQENIYQALKGRYAYADFVDIEVVDNGRGFDPKYRDYVFELLRKVDVNSAGFGVGLALCRKIATLHGGGISIDPTPGKGTRVQVLLPLTSSGVAQGR